MTTTHRKSVTQPRIWIMFTSDGWYPIEPSEKCKPEDHGNPNDHVLRIETIAGEVLWARDAQ